MVAASEKFLAKYCGTRYQEIHGRRCRKRLKENTVDISKVVLVKKEQRSHLLKSTTRHFSGDLAAGRYNYTGELQVQGQKLAGNHDRARLFRSGTHLDDISDSVAVMGQAFTARHPLHRVICRV